MPLVKPSALQRGATPQCASFEGDVDGTAVGLVDGDREGLVDGMALGEALGLSDGLALGDREGNSVGLVEGLALGASVLSQQPKYPMVACGLRKSGRIRK